MPHWLSRFFCLKPVECQHFGLSEVEGQEVHRGQRVWPCCRALPMGFTWSLYFCQLIGEHQ
eukprot:6158647-Lingulodinium_polyedra.AAC.1